MVTLSLPNSVPIALCRFLILFVILYMTQRSNFLTNRTIISSLHKLSPGLYQGFIRCWKMLLFISNSVVIENVFLYYLFDVGI